MERHRCSNCGRHEFCHNIFAEGDWTSLSVLAMGAGCSRCFLSYYTDGPLADCCVLRGCFRQCNQEYWLKFILNKRIRITTGVQNTKEGLT